MAKRGESCHCGTNCKFFNHHNAVENCSKSVLFIPCRNNEVCGNVLAEACAEECNTICFTCKKIISNSIPTYHRSTIERVINSASSLDCFETKEITNYDPYTAVNRV